MRSRPRPSVLVIQHTLVEGLGRLAPLLQARAIDIEFVRPDQPLAANALAAANGVIVLGGPMGVADAAAQPRLHAEIALLADAVRARTPVLGICLGSQLLAAALGAKVYRGARKELGWYDVTLEASAHDDALFRNAPARFKALHWHGDAFDLPAGAKHLAGSELTPRQAFCVGDSAWGLLFHVEAGRDEVRAMASAFAAEVAEVGETPEALLAATERFAPATTALAQQLFTAWLDRVEAHVLGE